MNGSTYVKITLRGNVILSIEKDGKCCFLWSTLAYLHPCKNSNLKKVSNFKQCYNELNINGFDFSYGFKCNDVQKFNE